MTNAGRKEKEKQGRLSDSLRGHCAPVRHGGRCMNKCCGFFKFWHDAVRKQEKPPLGNPSGLLVFWADTFIVKACRCNASSPPFLHGLGKNPAHPGRLSPMASPVHERDGGLLACRRSDIGGLACSRPRCIRWFCLRTIPPCLDLTEHPWRDGEPVPAFRF